MMVEATEAGAMMVVVEAVVTMVEAVEVETAVGAAAVVAKEAKDSRWKLCSHNQKLKKKDRDQI